MSILDNLCWFSSGCRKLLSKEEIFLLDALLLDAMCGELDKHYREENKVIVSKGVINLMLQDLIKSGDYTIGGVAAYAHLPEEVIYDIAIGTNTNPTLDVSRKIIQLHMGARSQLYQCVMQKITMKYLVDKSEDLNE